MNVDQPEVLSSYSRDHKAAGKHRLPVRILGWSSICILVLLLLCVLFFRSEAVLLGLFAVFLASSVAWALLKNKKRELRCLQCGQPMESMDVQWSIEQWKRSGHARGSTKGMFEGADGILYQAYWRRKTTGQSGAGARTYVIAALAQRWYACHNCRLCALIEPRLFDEVFKTDHKDKWKRAKKLVSEDPGAIQEGSVHNV